MGNNFSMGHVEISAIGDFTNFLKMYGNLSMAIAYTKSYRNNVLIFCTKKNGPNNVEKKINGETSLTKSKYFFNLLK